MLFRSDISKGKGYALWDKGGICKGSWVNEAIVWVYFCFAPITGDPGIRVGSTFSINKTRGVCRNRELGLARTVLGRDADFVELDFESLV